MKRVLGLVLVTLIFAGCKQDPVSKSRTNNPKIDAEILFDYDGCRVYRFVDGGYERYFARCSSSTSTSWNEQHGKHSSPREITTVEEK